MGHALNADDRISTAAHAALQSGLVHRLLELARDEDLGPDRVDLTGELMFTDSETRSMSVTARQRCVVSGTVFFEALVGSFVEHGEHVEHTILIPDGAIAEDGESIMTLSGSARAIVRIERTLLNTLSRLSGIATLTAHYVKLADNPKVQICDTRKTTPGLRVLEKYAVLCGGGIQHRMGLYDALLVKDNHLTGLDHASFVDRVGIAAKAARDRGASFVQVEVDTPDQLSWLLSMTHDAPDMVLLDNMSPETLTRCVAMRDDTNPSILLEASGGITDRTLPEIARTGVDRISIGALTHQAVSVDLGLDSLLSERNG